MTNEGILTIRPDEGKSFMISPRPNAIVSAGLEVLNRLFGQDNIVEKGVNNLMAWQTKRALVSLCDRVLRAEDIIREFRIEGIGYYDGQSGYNAKRLREYGIPASDGRLSDYIGANGHQGYTVSVMPNHRVSFGGDSVTLAIEDGRSSLYHRKTTDSLRIDKLTETGDAMRLRLRDYHLAKQLLSVAHKALNLNDERTREDKAKETFG